MAAIPAASIHKAVNSVRFIVVDTSFIHSNLNIDLFNPGSAGDAFSVRRTISAGQFSFQTPQGCLKRQITKRHLSVYTTCLVVILIFNKILYIVILI